MSRTRPVARDLAVIVLGGALLILPGLASVDLFNPDEPREAEIAREMRESGDLLVPTLNGCPFLEKPPLFYWSVLLLGWLPWIPAEASVRLPSALAAIGLLVVTYLIGRELFDRRTGRAAAVLLLSTFQFWWLARRALLDMTLAFFVAAALLCVLVAVRGAPSRARWLLLGGVAAAGAVLTKGLIGLVIPGLAVIAYLAWRREIRTLVSPAALAAALVPAAALAVWIGLLATRPDGESYVREFLVENHVKRFLGGGRGGHTQPAWYYLESLATDFLPWALFLPGALIATWPGLVRRRSAIGATDGLLHAWLLPALVVLSVASSKRSIYLLPLAPAAALLVASWWRAAGAGSRSRPRGPALAIPAALLVILGVLIAAAIPIAVGVLTTGLELKAAGDVGVILRTAPWGIPTGAALLLAVVAAVLAARRSARRGARAAIALALTVLLITGAALLPLAGPRLSARSFGEAIEHERRNGARVAAHRLTEGSIGQFLFYSNGPLDWIGRGGKEPESDCCDCRLATTAEEFLRGPGRRACLLLEDDFEALPPDLQKERNLMRGRVGGSRYVLLATRGRSNLPDERRRQGRLRRRATSLTTDLAARPPVRN